MGGETEHVLHASVKELTEGYGRGDFTPTEVAIAMLDRLAAMNPSVNAFVHVDRAVSLAQADLSAQRWAARSPLGPLDGVPITVKDLVPVAGWPMRRGSRAYEVADIVAEDAPCVARLREAGAVLLGKTATPDAGCMAVTQSQVHGVTHNPYDLSVTPGGSSGGAGAALALGIGTLAVGTDGGGSIRIPSAYCNLAGIKPSFGRVPIHPPHLFMPLPVIGPMGRRVADITAMLEVMARPDPRDPYALQEAFVAPDLNPADLSGLRVAYSPTLGCTVPAIDREIADACAGVAHILADAGATVEIVNPDWPVDPILPFTVFWEAGYAGYMDTFPPARQKLLDPYIQELAERGRRIDIVTYHRALAQRLALASASRNFFNSYDLCIGPVMAVAPFAAGNRVPPGASDDWSWCPFTYLWNMTGQPAASVPCGFTAAGLPIGVQIVAWIGREDLILRAAQTVETALPLYRKHPVI